MPLDAGSQNLPAHGGCFRRLRSRCGAVRIFAHGGDFSWQAQGKPCVLVLQSRLFVTQGIGAVLLRSAVFVAGAALWTRW